MGALRALRAAAVEKANIWGAKDGLRTLLHTVDIAAIVNEMAGQTLILHQVCTCSEA